MTQKWRACLMKILRAFQVINQDGQFFLSSTYNEINSDGDVVNRNVRDSFYVTDEAAKAHIKAIEDYIQEVRLGGIE